MSEAKFTEGPWAVCKANLSQYELGVGQVNGCIVCDICEDTDDDYIANANLIAAAPEMYELLNLLADRFAEAGNSTAMKEIDALLAKARGEK